MTQSQPYFETNDRPVSVNRIGVFDFPPHLHDDIEITFLSRGKMHVIIDGNDHIIGPDDMCIIFPKQVHSYTTDGGETPEGFMVIIKPMLVPNFNRLVDRYILGSPVIRSVSADEDLAYCVRTLEREHSLERETLISAIVNLLLSKVWISASLTQKKDQSDKLLFGVLDFISEHYSENIGLNDVAAALKVNKYTISRLFSDKMKVGFRKYINTLRLNNACMMLRTTDLSVTQICYDCGFETQRTFNRVFRESFGITPREYRKQP